MQGQQIPGTNELEKLVSIHPISKIAKSEALMERKETTVQFCPAQRTEFE